MTPRRSICACLVHESRECVIDLVRNLHHNGDARLLQGFPFERYNAVVHPDPGPMKWPQAMRSADRAAASCRLRVGGRGPRQSGPREAFIMHTFRFS